MHNLWVNRRCLKEFGVYVSGEGTFNSTERNLEVVFVPGRNGDLTFEKKSFKNQMVSYPAFIVKNFKQNAEMARNFLISQKSYCRIEDDYHKEIYRLGIYAGPLEFETKFLNKSAEFSLVFNCKPQRFLKSGDETIQIRSPQTLHNPYMPALPLIKVFGRGAGTVTVGDVTVTIENISEFIVLDSEVQNAYKGTQNQNNNIKLSNYQFPKLQTGENKISFGGGVTKIELTPRWWML